MEVKKLGIDNNAGEASVIQTNNYYNDSCKKKILEIERKLNKKDKHVKKLFKLIKTKTKTMQSMELVVKNMLPEIYFHIIKQEHCDWQNTTIVQPQLNLFEEIQKIE